MTLIASGEVGLPAELTEAVKGMDVSDELVRRYCLGPRVESSVAKVALTDMRQPDSLDSQPRSVLAGVLDLEDLMQS